MKNYSRFKNKNGSVIVGAIIIAGILAALCASYLRSAMTEYKLSRRTFELQSALNLAEAGLEEGIRAYNNDDWSSPWTPVSSEGHFLEDTSITFSDGRTGRLRIYVETAGTPMPIVVAEGTVIDVNGNEISRQVRVDLEVSSDLDFAMLSRNNIVLNGNGVTFASYDSRDGAYDSVDVSDIVTFTTENIALNRSDEGRIAALAVTNTAVSVNNGNVLGYAVTGGSSIDVGNNGFVLGFDSNWDLDSDGRLDNNENEDINRVTTDYVAEMPDVALPLNFSASSTDPDLSSGAVTFGNAALIGVDGAYTDVEFTGSVGLSGSEVITIAGPVRMHLEQALSLTGNAEIVIENGATLDIYVEGDATIAGNGLTNDAGTPSAFKLYGIADNPGDQDFRIAGNGEMYGVINAPNADITFDGGGGDPDGFFGSVIGNNITMTGNWEVVYDLALADDDTDASNGLKRWREFREASEKLDFSNPASVASAISVL